MKKTARLKMNAKRNGFLERQSARVQRREAQRERYAAAPSLYSPGRRREAGKVDGDTAVLWGLAIAFLALILWFFLKLATLQ